MTRIVNLEEIKEIVKTHDISSFIEQGFEAYSKGLVIVPPVGELIFDDPPGDTHIKYGYIKNDDYFVIKIASGFYENYKLDLPTGSGLMLLFSQKTGNLECILLDEGYLTDVRTALAGQIVAKFLAPKNVQCIGVFGTGIQARMQVQYLENLNSCRELAVWGRSEEKLKIYKHDMEALGYNVFISTNSVEVINRSNLIITSTPAKEPLIQANELNEGTHITAMGSDTFDKQELDPKILSRADIVCADSIKQCLERGEICHAIKSSCIKQNDVIEIGKIITNPSLGRTSEKQITVADLTGVAVQDVQIAKMVFSLLK